MKKIILATIALISFVGSFFVLGWVESIENPTNDELAKAMFLSLALLAIAFISALAAGLEEVEK